MRPMAGSSRWVAWAATLCLAAVPLRAQTLDDACLASRVSTAVPEDSVRRARHPSVLLPELQRYGDQLEWAAAMRRIQQLYRADAHRFAEGDGLIEAYTTVRDDLDVFASKLDAALRADDNTGVQGATRFAVSQDPSTGDFLLLDGSVRVARNANVFQAEVLCYLGHTMGRFHELLTKQARSASELRLRERVDRWDAWLASGLVPLPWELAANEGLRWFGRAGLEPPARQLIFLRPSAALETTTRFDARSDLLVVEVAGLAVYGAKRERYVSASFMWAAPEGGEAGLGVLFRVSPWLTSVGWLRRDVDADGRADNRIVVAVDAFDLFASAPARLKTLATQATGLER